MVRFNNIVRLSNITLIQLQAFLKIGRWLSEGALTSFYTRPLSPRRTSEVTGSHDNIGSQY